MNSIRKIDLTIILFCCIFVNNYVNSMNSDEASINNQFDAMRLDDVPMQFDAYSAVSHIEKNTSFFNEVLPVVTSSMGAAYWINSVRNPWFALFLIGNNVPVITPIFSKYCVTNKAENNNKELPNKTVANFFQKLMWGGLAMVAGFKYIKPFFIKKQLRSLQCFVFSNMVAQAIGISQSALNTTKSTIDEKEFVSDDADLGEFLSLLPNTGMFAGAILFGQVMWDVNKNPFLNPLILCLSLQTGKKIVNTGTKINNYFLKKDE